MIYIYLYLKLALLFGVPRSYSQNTELKACIQKKPEGIFIYLQLFVEDSNLYRRLIYIYMFIHSSDIKIDSFSY